MKSLLHVWMKTILKSRVHLVALTPAAGLRRGACRTFRANRDKAHLQASRNKHAAQYPERIPSHPFGLDIRGRSRNNYIGRNPHYLYQPK